MKHTVKWLGTICLLFLACIAADSSATQLTFDVYTDSGKTAFANATFIPQSYGDNVTNFSPTTSFGGYYFNYGSAGGATPHVTVEYRYLSVADPQDTRAGQNGTPNGYLWNNDYGDLTNVVYDIYGGAGNTYYPSTPGYYMEIRLTADPQYRVTLSNFDIAGWPHANYSGQTLKIVRDANSASAATLWSAGPDGGVTVHGIVPAHDHYEPNVLVADGHTLSLIYGLSGNIAVDNITFFESVPEPSSLLLISLCLGGLVIFSPRRVH